MCTLPPGLLDPQFAVGAPTATSPFPSPSTSPIPATTAPNPGQQVGRLYGPVRTCSGRPVDPEMMIALPGGPFAIETPTIKSGTPSPSTSPAPATESPSRSFVAVPSNVKVG